MLRCRKRGGGCSDLKTVYHKNEDVGRESGKKP
jgi:hypothetical protein